MTLTGTWTRVDSPDCARSYPDEIEFRTATYLARKGAEQGFVVWDAGGVEIVDPHTVKIDTATDEQVLYRFAIDGDVLAFTDPAGCTFRYRRRS